MNATSTSLRNRIAAAVAFNSPVDNEEIEVLYRSVKSILRQFLSNDEIEAQMLAIRQPLQHPWMHTSQADWLTTLARVTFQCPICSGEPYRICGACKEVGLMTAADYDQATSYAY